MVSNFVKFDKLCRANGRHLDPGTHRLLCNRLEASLITYNALAAQCVLMHEKRYKLLPKFHAMSHYFDVAINPRKVQCYADEDMVGRMKKIYVKCHGATAPKRSLQRYAIVVCIRWWALLRDLRGIP